MFFSWTNLYPEMPEAPFPMNPPVKVQWGPDLPENLMRMATSEVATPLFVNTMNAFSLGAIGIFASMFMSFLDRRKELGIMKTVGIDNARTVGCEHEVILRSARHDSRDHRRNCNNNLLYHRNLGERRHYPLRNTGDRRVLAGAILSRSDICTNAMARQGTVMELLYERSIPLVRKGVEQPTYPAASSRLHRRIARQEILQGGVETSVFLGGVRTRVTVSKRRYSSEPRGNPRGSSFRRSDDLRYSVAWISDTSSQSGPSGCGSRHYGGRQPFASFISSIISIAASSVLRATDLLTRNAPI